MQLIDRYILVRFFANFAALFSLLFVFAISIDVILQLEDFLDAASLAVDDGRMSSVPFAFAVAVANFHGPRVFQFYGYMVGLVSVASMGFTLAQMHRHRELVAMLSSGISLHRAAVPIIAGAFVLNMFQILNQELVLPRLAPLLIREHERILKPAILEFPVKLTPDGNANLLLAQSLNASTGQIQGLLFIERDKSGLAVRRISADSARYDDSTGDWTLENGWAIRRRTEATTAAESFREVVKSLKTDLSPHALLVRQFFMYAQMLSLQQINEAERLGGFDPDALARFRYSRLSAVLVNLLVLLLTLPSFLLREPPNLLRQSIECAIIAVPAIIGAFIGMTVTLPGLSPAVAVFLPVIILIPLVLSRITAIRT